MRLILSLLALVALTACSTPGTLTYTATESVQPGPANSVASVTVIDKRDEKPNRVATIRGGFGNPLKVLDTTEPVATLVGAAFTKALQERQMLAPAAAHRLLITLNAYYGDQYLGPRAEIKLDLAVLDPTNQVIYTDTINDGTADYAYFANGIFANIEGLRLMVELLLNRTIDRMLDKPGLSRALATPPRLLLGAPSS